MAVPRAVRSLVGLAIVAALLVPLTYLWLSGRFEDRPERELQPPRSTLATLPRSETSITAAPRPPATAGSIPTPAPPVTVGPGAVTVPPPVPGAAAAPPPREGRVVDPPPAAP